MITVFRSGTPLLTAKWIVSRLETNVPCAFFTPPAKMPWFNQACNDPIR